MIYTHRYCLFTHVALRYRYTNCWVRQNLENREKNWIQIFFIDLQGYTALHIAMQFDHENIFNLLVQVYGESYQNAVESIAADRQVFVSLLPPDDYIES